MRKVILDTSILFRVAETGLPLFNELDRLLVAYEPVVLRKTVKEIEILSGAKKKRLKAKLARELIKKCKIIEEDFPGYGDDLIIEAAKRLNAIVATADSKLMKRLLKEGIPVVYPRDYKTLQIAGEDVWRYGSKIVEEL